MLRPSGRLLRRRPEPATGSEADGAAEVWKGRLLALPVLGLVLLIASGFDDIVALYKYPGGDRCGDGAGAHPSLVLVENHRVDRDRRDVDVSDRGESPGLIWPIGSPRGRARLTVDRG